MGAIARLADTLLELAGLHLRPWMAPVALLVLGLVLLPLLWRNHRTGAARRLLRRLSYTAAAERPAMEDRILALVSGNGEGLVVVAQEAQRLGRSELARRAREALAASGAHPQRVAALERGADTPHAPTPAQESLAIHALVSAGLLDEARRRLDAGRRRWPEYGEWPAMPEKETS